MFRLPMNGTFELTGRCNLACKMCLVKVDHKRIQTMNLCERSADEWIHMAEEVYQAGTLNLLLTGGEVMLRPDFCEIYEAIAKMGFLLTLYTNATLVTDSIMEVLEKYPPHKIGVTLYGTSNDTYSRISGCKDGFDRFVEGTKKLKELPSLFDTRTTLIKDNYDDLPAMKAFVESEFGPNQILHISRMVINSIRGGIQCPSVCRLSPEDNAHINYSGVFELAEKVKHGEIQRVSGSSGKLSLMRYSLPEKEEFLFKNCGAGIHSYAINWSGRMYGCELMTEGYTEPFEEGFSSAWERLPHQYPKSRVIEACAKCKYAALCQACPAARIAETGDWFGIPEYSCQEAKCIYSVLEELESV